MVLEERNIWCAWQLNNADLTSKHSDSTNTHGDLTKENRTRMEIESDLQVLPHVAKWVQRSRLTAGFVVDVSN